MRRLFFNFLLVASLLVATTAFAQWPNGYSYKATFVVQAGQVTGTQVSFTAVVAGTNAGLKTLANGGHVQNTCPQTLYGLTVPADLIFTSDSAGTTLLHWQFDTYSAATGAYSAHVLMSNIDTSSNNTLYAWYGKSSATSCQGGAASAAWDTNTASALATPNGSSLNTSDYIGNTVTTGAGGVSAAAGLNSGAAAFSRALTSNLQVAGQGSRTPPYTWCVWDETTAGADPGSLPTPDAPYWLGSDHDSTGSYNSLGLRMTDTTGVVQAQIYGGGAYPFVQSTTAINDGSWHQVCQVVTSGTMTLYVDGGSQGTPASWSGSNAGGVSYLALGTAGGYTAADYAWSGDLAESTLDNTNRSANWIAARYKNVSSPATFWSVAYNLTSSGGSFTVSPATIPSGHAGNLTLTLSGTGTTWVNGTTVMTTGGVSGVSCGAVSVSSATAATLTCTTGSGTGTLTITESVTGSSSATVTVAAPTLTDNYLRGNLNSVQTLTMTGTNTIWTLETAAGLFTVSGGTGAGIGTPTVVNNTTASVALTVGTAVGSLTVTDTSTGKTVVFGAGGSSGVVGWAGFQ
jgi:hypothetical protein